MRVSTRVALLGTEASESLEVEPQVVTRVPLGWIEDEHVSAHGQSDSDSL